MIIPAPQTLPCLHCQALTSERDQLCCSGCRFLYKGGWGETQPRIVESAYDQPNVRKLYSLSENADRPLYRLSVQGLQCSSCIHVLEDLPLFLDSITFARVNFAAGEMLIETTPQHSLGLILKFIEDMGYPAQPLRSKDSGTELHLQEERALLLRMAVAGACAGNIMLFAVAIYGGLVGTTAFIFNGISLILFLPVLFYSAQPFHKGAWNALRMGYITVDVPLVAALWLGFLASLFNWWRGSGNVYFDSTAGFFFFILLSRWFLRISQRKWGQGFFSYFSLEDTFYKIQRSGENHNLPASQILPGDKVTVPSSERLPVDGVLTSPTATLDTAWITGEAVPRTFQSSMTVAAGYKVLSQEVTLIASGSPNESELTQSLRRMESQSLKESVRVSLFDKAAQWLLLGVFSISALLMIVGPPLLGWTWDDAFERALSLLVVACPCALAFGGPLAYGMGLRKASEKGILIKSADVLDRVLECRHLVFDKTGTLTLGQLKMVSQCPAAIPGWMKDVILSLEELSHHPVAYAFRQAWPRRSNVISLQDVREVTGKKVFGLHEGRLYSVQSHASESGSLVVAFHQEEQVIATFEFEDILREEAVPLLKELSKKFQLSILSGDSQTRVDALAHTLGVNFFAQRGHMSPQNKAQCVQDQPLSLMLGDGLNDAEALASAHVGIVVQGPLAQSLRFGSVYFMKPGLHSLKDLFEIAKKTQTLVRRNLLFALAYNILAGGAAICGLVDPLVAAALMPLSSALILLSTWRASK